MRRTVCTKVTSWESRGKAAMCAGRRRKNDRTGELAAQKKQLIIDSRLHLQTRILRVRAS